MDKNAISLKYKNIKSLIATEKSLQKMNCAFIPCLQDKPQNPL
jgi:hypothetical protein